jgi:hypothetical protein
MFGTTSVWHRGTKLDCKRLLGTGNRRVDARVFSEFELTVVTTFGKQDKMEIKIILKDIRKNERFA